MDSVSAQNGIMGKGVNGDEGYSPGQRSINTAHMLLLCLVFYFNVQPSELLGI